MGTASGHAEELTADNGLRDPSDVGTEMIMDDSNGDAGMGAVTEAASEEEMGIVHEDVEDENPSMLLAQLGHASKSQT